MVNKRIVLIVCSRLILTRSGFIGVKPKDGDWSPQNALFFKEYVDGEVFASYVMAVGQDRTLCLQLMKMSDSEDISVSDYLVGHGHAIAV